MKLIFAGTPAFAVPSLEALIGAGHRIAAVYTQPDRPAGRGRRPKSSPIKQLAEKHGLMLHQPATLRASLQAVESVASDAMIVVAYGLMVPTAMLAVPKFGCLNVHASLLPRWRGAAPVARAIEAGDRRTGVCIMRLESGLDTGPVYGRRETVINGDDTTATLEPRLASLGADLLVETLERIETEQLVPHTQDPRGATYARKLQKDEAIIDWRLPAAVIHRKVRAFNPWPVASTNWAGRALRLWEVAPLVPDSALSQVPGTVIRADDAGLVVQTGSGGVTITCLQIEGGRPMSVGDFLNGHRIGPGDQLGTERQAS